jgi:Xaa-Pro dipeptidase
MIYRAMFFIIAVMFTVTDSHAQQPLPQRTPETDAEALRLMRIDKLDLILPGAMRDNNVDMWIHVTRSGDPDPMAQILGGTSGYLVFTDLGDRIERAVFGSAGAVENIDIRGSVDFARAIGPQGEGFRVDEEYGEEAGYVYVPYPREDPDVYDEFREFVAERDPKTIALNTSAWIVQADGISHSEYLRLEKILGPKYSQRIVSAENVISDFIIRRTSREVGAQIEVLALARQRALQYISKIVPGVTTVREAGARVYYSATSKPEDTVHDFPPDVRYFIPNPDYVLQRGDFFVGGGGGGSRGSYMGFGVDTKIHCYILREGETKVPDFLQRVYDKAIAGQWIMRDHMKVGMTGGESLDAMVKAMEDAGYIYTPFVNSRGLTADGKNTLDYLLVQKALANKGTDVAGFSIDNHSFGNTGMGNGIIGPSMSGFRPDTHHLKIQENHLFAFEYMVHMNIAERPGYPLCFNISNPQIVTSRGVEWLQPPNEEIYLIH